MFVHPVLAALDPRHPELGIVAQIPQSNRSTYGQIVQLKKPRLESENIFTLGQSGFISFVPPSGFALGAHFLDQNALYREFQYKPMPLYLNTQLQQ